MLAKASYLAKHHGMAVSAGLLARAWHSVLRTRMRHPTEAEIRVIRRRFADLLRRDWRNAAAGVYPRRLLFDVPVREYLRALPAAIADWPRVVRRIRRRDFHDLPAGVPRNRYPDYYLRNFHWQTDGWLSDRSARIYDFGVDLLFGGATDVMRRMVVPPVASAVRGIDAPRILDIACGTGRLLGALHAALPDARLHGLDLSPFYLAEARKRLADARELTLCVENAETLPFRDGYFDAVTSVFLFHELPRDARRRVAAEALRVLRPGGRFVVLDSAQLSESADIAYFLDEFHRLYHEPYYKGYLRDDLDAMLAEVGFTAVGAEPAFVAKLAWGSRP